MDCDFELTKNKGFCFEMGFASFFEDILSKIGRDFAQIVYCKQQSQEHTKKPHFVQGKSPMLEDIPQAFTIKTGLVLQQAGVPKYLINQHIRWTYQYIKGEKSIEKIWEEFEGEAMPLLTEHLKDDLVTQSFVRKLLSK